MNVNIPSTTALFTLRPFCCFSFTLYGKLTVIKRGIKSILLEQAVVIALFHNMPVLHHNDNVRLPDCGKPVRYNKETRKGRILPFRCPLRLILFHKNHL